MSKSQASNTRKSRLAEPYGQKLPTKTVELLNILENNDTKIELISTGSLSGFIFKISNNEGSYIMKILVLTDTEKQLLENCMDSIPSLIIDTNKKIKDKNTGEQFTIFNKRSKVTELKKDFIYESEIQNFIYNESKRGKRNPICPAVSYTKIYDNALSKHFLKKLRDKTAETGYIKINGVLFNPRERKFTKINNRFNEKNGVFNCLQYHLSNPEYKIGIILMPEFENSITLSKIPDDELHMALNSVYPQIIYLFLIIGVMNFDMHQGNILVSIVNEGPPHKGSRISSSPDVNAKESKIITSKLIDFGKVDNLNNIGDSYFLFANEKNYINVIRKHLMNELIEIVFPKKNIVTQQTKHNFILKTMNIINLLCWIVNKRIYNNDNVLEHQMYWFVPVESINLFMTRKYDTFKKKKETINFDNLNYEIKNLDLHNYNYTEENNYVQAFELLKNNYVTMNTKGNTYTNLPVVELTLTHYNMTKPPAEEAPMWIDNSVRPKNCNNNVKNKPTCIIMGGKNRPQNIQKSLYVNHTKNIPKNLLVGLIKKIKICIIIKVIYILHYLLLVIHIIH